MLTPQVLRFTFERGTLAVVSAPPSTWGLAGISCGYPITSDLFREPHSAVARTHFTIVHRVSESISAPGSVAGRPYALSFTRFRRLGAAVMDGIEIYEPERGSGLVEVLPCMLTTEHASQI